MRLKLVAAGCGLLVSLAGCGDKPAPVETAATETASAPVESADLQPAGGVSSGITARDGTPVPLVAFDIGKVAVSTAALGTAPFVALPDDYAPNGRPQQRTFARFPFRLGDGIHWVEGASWNALLVIGRGAKDKNFSAPELRRALDAELAGLGAQKVFDGPLRRDVYYGPQLEDEIGGGFLDGVNMTAQAPTLVHVIRQADRTVWIQSTVDEINAGLVVVEERPFQASANWGGEFPYLSLPEGYRQRNRPIRKSLDAIPVWNGSAFESVEGQTFAVSIDRADGDFSRHEVLRNLEAMMAQAGGVVTFQGRIPKEAASSVPEGLRSTYGDAIGYVWSDDDVVVYRVDHPQKPVRVLAKLNYQSAGWLVIEGASP